MRPVDLKAVITVYHRRFSSVVELATSFSFKEAYRSNYVFTPAEASDTKVVCFKFYLGQSEQVFTIDLITLKDGTQSLNLL